MSYLFKAAFITITTLFFCSKCLAQRITYLPDSLKHLFAKNCTVCQLHPAYSTKLYTTDSLVKNMANFHNGMVEFANGNLDESYTYTLNFIAHADTVESKKTWLYAWFIKAKILYYKKLYTAAQAEYKRLLEIIPTGEYLLKSNIYTNMGELYLAQGQFKEALDYFTLWQKYFTASSDGYSAETVCQDMGVCFFNTGKVKEAKESFIRGVDLATQLNDTRSLSTACANLANFYYGQFQDSLAIPYFKKSLSYAQKAGDIEILKDANLNMAVVEENRNNFKAALGYRKLYEQLQDSIWNRDNIWKLTSQERKFDAQLNKNKIQLLEQQAALRNNELKTRNLQRNSLFAAALALLVIASLIFLAYRLKAKKNLLITKQKEELDILNKTKDRLYSIVAHDLRSPIRSLKTNLAGAKQSLLQNNMAEAEVFIGNAQTTATNTFSLIDNLLNWALSQTNQLFFNPEKLQLATVVKHVCFDYAPFATTKKITLQQNIESSLYVRADINSLKIILRNLLDNAIKYTPPNGFIQLNAVIINNQCCLQVKDNGIGMDETTLSAIFTDNGQKIMQDSNGYTSTGFGLGLCMLMAQKNNGTLQITSTKGIGTQANVYLPLTN